MWKIFSVPCGSALYKFHCIKINNQTFSIFNFNEVCYNVIWKGFDKVSAECIDSGAMFDALAKFLQLFETELIRKLTRQSAG
jgi:hypothetical protein